MSSPADRSHSSDAGPAAPPGPLHLREHWEGDGVRGARVSILREKRPFRLSGGRKKKDAKGKKKKKRDRHSRTKVAFMRYGYYDLVFKYFVEQVLDADFVWLGEPTRRTVELGSRHATDYVCSPFKHILGDYIEALEAGADVLVQVTGPCRLGYYGELQESILRDLGYDFEMLNFATVEGGSAADYIKICQKKVNPDVGIAGGVKNLLAVAKMIECLDEYNDAWLAQAGFEVERGSFSRARDDYFAAMRDASCPDDILRAHREGMRVLRGLEVSVPADPVRVGVVGEYFTAPVPHANLHVEDKLVGMGVSVARMMNMTNRNLRYNEKNLRAGISEYVTYDMGPTSSLTLAAAKKYAQEGFDGVIHVKSAGCTPEIDCMPVLQRISSDYGMPILYLSFDSQTSDTGLDTRLEAFYDMISRRKLTRR